MKRLTWISMAIVLSAACLAMGQPKAPPALPAGTMSFMGQLTAARTTVDKDPAAVLKDVNTNLLKYPNIELPIALYLKGKAQAALAMKEKDPVKTAMLRQAALDFVKVATFFPYSPDAPPAMLEAAKALDATGDEADKAGAQALVDLKASRYTDAAE